jgi:hypothetical protein
MSTGGALLLASVVGLLGAFLPLLAFLAVLVWWLA